ncbi:MAG: hypothetical protein U9O94_05250 [Nanoarchaeota archaeon]|nr:hypothetical protein [Nanoarchaeota archaeon]
MTQETKEVNEEVPSSIIVDEEMLKLFHILLFGTLTEYEVRERFRILNEKYGWFRVYLSQGGFPDIRMINHSYPDFKRGADIGAEVEVKANNFNEHKHDINKCDMIICWKRGYKKYPIPVLEINKLWEKYEQDKNRGKI